MDFLCLLVGSVPIPYAIGEIVNETELGIGLDRVRLDYANLLDR